MKLKKIVLYGFKSFADKTAFEFGDGVTVIVGPNGCGKSNIVDAVRWVLGEQSAKSLRGGQMLDVIFNGTNSRKSMGTAEVSLFFTNTTGLLNTDMEEVCVTRRLYRSGESEYLLNNKLCRLKDIREMFMGTGVGADSYSIIEQGKVEILLQSSKTDRRAVFEEAAGISRYKARKKEALRKLERTEQNVLRIQDIIGELEKRLRSIKYQAGKARNYQKYSDRLRELRMNQFLSEYYQLRKDGSRRQQQRQKLQDELVGLTTQIEQAQGRLSVLDHEIDGCEDEIRQLENQRLQFTSRISSEEDHIEMGHQRCEELQGFLQRNQKQIQSLRRQSRKLEEEIATGQKDVGSIRDQLDELQEQLKRHQDSRQERILQLNEHRAQMEDEKSGLIDIVRRTAQLHNEIKSLDMRRDNLSGQKNRLSDRYGRIKEEMEGLLTRRAQLDEKLGEITSLKEDSQGQLENRRQQLSQLNEDKLVCSENLSAAKEYRSGMLSRQQLLSDMEAKLEGVDQGVRQILQARQQDPEKFYYVKGMVAELLRAEVKYAGIVEAALAGRSQHLVATSSQAVLEDSENLDELAGRVKMICLDRLGPFKNGFDFTDYPEVQGRLIDLVSFAPDCESLAWRLLGKTILVDTIDAALRLAEVAPAGYRWVTLTGEVLEADGTLHLGPLSGAVGLISRKSELRQLKEDIVETEERITDIQNQLQQYDNQGQHLEKNLQELRTVIYEANTVEIETRGQLEQVDQNVGRLKQEQPLIASEVESIEGQIQESLNQQKSSRQSLDDLESINQQRQERVDELEGNIRRLEEEDQQVLNQITDLKVSLGQTQQRQLALQERLTNLKSQYQQCNHEVGNLQTDLNNAQESHKASERAILIAESKLAELFQARQEHQEISRQKKYRRDELFAEKEQLVELAGRLQQQREERQEQLHEMQIKLNENHLRCENLMERGREELDMDLAEKFSSYEHQDMDWQAVSTEIEDLRKKIHRLGNINLDAIKEQEELEERLEYLSGQYQDLAQARRQLEELIDKINRESTELFMTNFEAIRANFAELFRKLFGGGKAEIILEDPEDILECGIEIIARPPGKQLQSISLLSGGEKTMTAVALLLAIFKSKPSPFCLLDEVDAALDEANVERFNLLIQEFVKESQFIVITHSRRTMTIADVIYGITMQEQGVSKKVSVRFADEEEPQGSGNAVA